MDQANLENLLPLKIFQFMVNACIHVNMMFVLHMHVPYIGNRSQKKMFADFTNLGLFANIFLYYFLLITKKFN